MSQYNLSSSGGGGGGGIITIDGDTGSATGSTITLTGGSTGFTFVASGDTITMEGSGGGAGPAFVVYQSTSPAGVVGDGTVFILPFDTALSNVGAHFDTTTFTFTAPTTGLYQFNLGALANTVEFGTSSINIQIITTANTFIGQVSVGSSTGGPNTFGMNMSMLCPMTAGDTAQFGMQATNGVGNQIGVTGGVSNTYVSGYLI